jgi:thiol-disulfide isomerase/thioredoxin
MTSKLLIVSLLVALLPACLAGCLQDQSPSIPQPPGPTPSASATTTSIAGASAADAEITLVPADEKDLAALIAKNKGKVVFVDYWATFCGPCKKAFPHTVELHKKHQAEGLAVISVDFDLLEDEAKVKDFLQKQGATFDNLISKYDGGGTDANDAFGIGPLPHLRLYDRKGTLRHKWEGKATDLDAKVKELLAEKG